MADFQVDHHADSLARDLHRAGAALVDLEATNAEAGRVILARTNPPRKTGATAAGLFARADDRDLVLASSTAYWTFPHWGAPRRHIKANPYLLSATEASTAEVVDLYTEHARRSLDLVKE